jgi:hypothetical protein
LQEKSVAERKSTADKIVDFFIVFSIKKSGNYLVLPLTIIISIMELNSS